MKIPFWNTRWSRRAGGGFELTGNHIADDPPEVIAEVYLDGTKWRGEIVSDCCNPETRGGFKRAKDAKTWATEKAGEPLRVRR